MTTWSLAGHCHVTVAVKATFDLSGAATTRLGQPREIARHDLFDGQALVEPSELAPYLPQAEMLYTGPAREGGRVVLYAENALVDRTLRSPSARELGGLSPQAPARAAKCAPEVIARLLEAARTGAMLVIPDDFDWTFFHAAPAEQRCRFLRGNEWLALEGLGLQAPKRIRCQLPGVVGVARVRGPDGAVADVAMQADSLRVDGAQLTASLIWRGSFSVAAVDLLGQLRIWGAVSSTVLQPCWPDDARRADEAAARREPPTWATSTFSESTVLLSETDLAAPDETPAAASPPTEAAADTGGTVMLSDADLQSAAETPATPFAAAPAKAAAGEPPVGTVLLGDADQAQAASRAAHPFEADGEPAPALLTPAPIPGAPWTREARQSPPPPLGDAQVTVVLGDLFDEPPADSERHHSAAPWDVAARRRQAALGDRQRPAPSPTTVAHRLADLPIAERQTDRLPIIKAADVEAVAVPWQLRPPRDSITIIVKQSFDIDGGGLPDRRDRAEPLTGELPAIAGTGEAVRYPSDFAVFKPRADVVLLGHAYPARKGGNVGAVRFRFGHPGRSFERRIAAFGPRHWKKAAALTGATEPEPFDRVELRQEHAFGGPGFSQNLVGMGSKTTTDDAGHRPLPLLEDPKRLITSPSDQPRPACIGAIAARAPGRWSKLGTYDARWLKTRWPYFPDDFDWTFYQSAPGEQQLGHLHGDEPFEITGALPDGEILRGELPAVRQRCFRICGKAEQRTLEEVVLRLDTVVFDTDAMQLHCIWRGVFETISPEAPESAALFIVDEPVNQARPMSEVVDALARALEPAEEPETGALTDDEISTVQLDGAASRAGSPTPAVTEISEDDADDSDSPDLVVGDLSAGGVLAAKLAELAAEKGAAGTGLLAQLAEQAEQRWRDGLQSLGLVVDEAEEEAPADVADAAEDSPPIDAEAAQPDVAAPPDLSGPDLQGADLAGRDLRGQKLAGFDLREANLTAAQLDDADLQGADLAGAKLSGASLARADLRGASLQGAVLDGAVLCEAALSQADLSDCTAAGADFRHAQGARVTLSGATLRGARFDEAQLPKADLTRAVIDAAIFDGAQLSGCRLFGTRGEGTSFGNATLERAQADGASLPGAKLERAHAAYSLWEGAHLEGATFHSAQLAEASFVRAHCAGAIFSAADLQRARLMGADLSDAAFLKANLMQATVENARLSRCDFSSANLYGVASWRASSDDACFDSALRGNTQLGGAS